MPFNGDTSVFVIRHSKII